MMVRTFEFWMPRRAQRQALAILRAADTIRQCLFADFIHEIGVEIIADKLQHHIERSRSARAGVEIAVHFKQVGIDLRLGESLGKARQVFPMDGATPAGEKPGCRQNMCAGA
ncbi:hypothetical protein H711_01292 [Brucella ovis IntaBari-2009-88-3]|nr:hypothetical protein DK51_164 [Brucella abortus]ENU06210.1 hypothetical protein H719_01283 [Brucella ovis IntaBari-1993-758]EPG42333.1 hypothetical protein H711_01292 [Brucella ovis IntaBari-2009-88-3]